MRRQKGFTLIEAMVVVGVLGILTGLTVFSLSGVVRSARLSGQRFTLVRALDFARSRALAVGRDVYVLFVDVDQDRVAPDPRAPRMLVYDDREMALRGHLADAANNPLEVVDAHPGNIRERFVADASSGLFFRSHAGTTVASCPMESLPPYFGITGERRTRQDCAPAWCTFCSKFGSMCVGAIRFSADGVARVVTGPAGSGGMIKLVDLDDARRSVCIGITEPAGLVNTLPN